MIARRQRIVLLVLVTMLLASVALGATLTYRLQSGTVAGGGGNLSGGSYRAGITVGQPTSGELMEGGPYRVASGFWQGASGGPTVVYLPAIARQ